MLLDELPSVPLAVVVLHLDDATGRVAAQEASRLQDRLWATDAKLFIELLSEESIPMWQIPWSPTYLFFKNGNEIDRHRGLLDRDGLLEWMRQIR